MCASAVGYMYIYIYIYIYIYTHANANPCISLDKEKLSKAMRNRVQCHRAQLHGTAFSLVSVNAIFESQIVQKQCLSDSEELSGDAFCKPSKRIPKK